ncbi:hypothetical protein ALC60_05576, partial [Trachymyrmex zeteki]
NVFSCSECPPKFRPPLFRPTASISSINNIHGACFRAMENISRTLEGPTPTNISKNSEPDTVIKGTFASPAVALANKVLPVPGGPVKNTTYMYDISAHITSLNSIDMLVFWLEFDQKIHFTI